MSDKYSTVRKFMDEHARMHIALESLVKALGETSWSSWQSTAKFDKELEQAANLLVDIRSEET